MRQVEAVIDDGDAQALPGQPLLPERRHPHIGAGFAGVGAAGLQVPLLGEIGIVRQGPALTLATQQRAEVGDRRMSVQSGGRFQTTDRPAFAGGDDPVIGRIGGFVGKGETGRGECGSRRGGIAHLQQPLFGEHDRRACFGGTSRFPLGGLQQQARPVAGGIAA